MELAAMSNILDLAVLLTLILASLKLTGVINLPWLLVFTPALIYLLLATLALLLLINIFYFRDLSNWPFIK
jgi:hypothetical protein